MIRSKAFLFAGALAAASGGWALAVDLPPVPVLPQPGPEAEEFSGWYLRGDVGWGQAEKPDLESAPNAIPLAVAEGFLSRFASQAFNNTTLSPFGMVDAGVGYQFNDWLRVDATLEYRGGAQLRSLYTLTDLHNPVFGGPLQYADFYRANLSAVVGLVNGYVSLPAAWGISPFVGAGIGFADNSLSGFAEQGFAYASSGSIGTAGGYFSNASKTDFAWALMAGLDFNVTPNLKLEASYRYLNEGKITTGEGHCRAGAAGGGFGAADCSGGVVRSTNTLASNDFRLGLIWLLGEPAQPPPAPVVARF